jgi:hypothetical protein
MAVTWAATAIVEGVSSRGKRTKQCVLTATGTYTTGGDPLPVAAIGLKGVTRLWQEGAGGFIDPGFNISLAGTVEAPLIAAFNAATGGAGAVTQVANLTVITGKTLVALVEGY